MCLVIELWAPFGLRILALCLLSTGVDVVVADMLDLPFEPESFDLVIEKGTMVSMLTSLFDLAYK